MRKAIGTLLRALSVIWFAFAIIRLFAELTGFTRGSDIILGIIDLLIAVATFKFGTWLKNREKGPPVRQHVQRAESAWWQAGYGFRLSVFLGVIWAIGCYFWQDDYYRDLGLVFWPPVGLLAAYFGYCKIVVGTTTKEFAAAVPTDTSTSRAADGPRVRKEVEESQSINSISNQTSKDRERAMNELINKMK